MSHEALLSGSHAYGTPHPDSDVDLVVYLSPDDARKLIDNADSVVFHSPGYRSCRYGKLNLMVCIDDKHYEVWKDGIGELKLNAPVTREFAIALFEGMRAEARIPELYRYHIGGDPEDI